MDNLFIKGKDERPQVNFNAETGVLELSRSSYPEYTKDLYQPVMDWLDEYLHESGKKIEFNFKMDYFNTSTSQRFQKIIKKLEDYRDKKNGEVVINWYYEKTDIDMFENGEDYSKDVKVPFNLIAYEIDDD